MPLSTNRALIKLNKTIFLLILYQSYIRCITYCNISFACFFFAVDNSFNATSTDVARMKRPTTQNNSQNEQNTQLFVFKLYLRPLFISKSYFFLLFSFYFLLYVLSHTFVRIPEHIISALMLTVYWSDRAIAVNAYTHIIRRLLAVYRSRHVEISSL